MPARAGADGGRRPLRSVAVMLALAATGWSEDGAIGVRGIPIEPFGNLRVADGGVALHPKASVGAGYDGNVYATDRDERDDAYLIAMGGIAATYRPTAQDLVDLDAELGSERYLTEHARSDVVGRVDARAEHTALDWRGGLVLGYARANDPLIEIGTRVLRDDYTAGLSGTRLGQRWAGRAEVGVQRVAYREDAGGIAAGERSRDTLALHLRVDRIHAADSRVYARASHDRTTYDRDGVYQDPIGVLGCLGIEQRFATRTLLFAEAGAVYRRYERPFLGDQHYADRTVLGPAGQLGARWNLEEGSHVAARLFSRVEDGVSANAMVVHGIDADLRVRFLARLAGIAGLAVSASRDSGAPMGRERERRRNAQARAGVEYHLPRGAAARLLGTYATSDSAVFNDFQRSTISVEFAAVL